MAMGYLNRQIGMLELLSTTGFSSIALELSSADRPD
jgi:hypothetical protein